MTKNNTRGENTPLKDILEMDFADAKDAKFQDFIGVLTVMFEELTGKRKSKPYKTLTKWIREYGKKRVFELLQYLVRLKRPTDNPVGYISKMLKDGFVESVEYPEIEPTEDFIYGEDG